MNTNDENGLSHSCDGSMCQLENISIKEGQREPYIASDKYQQSKASSLIATPCGEESDSGLSTDDVDPASPKPYAI